MAFSLTHSQILFANCADRVTMSLVLYAAWENVDVCNMYTVSLSLLKVHSTGADPGFLKGGVQVRIRDFSQAPPFGHCPRDVICPQKN